MGSGGPKRAGSVPANTLPVTVVSPPLEQATCWRQRPTQLSGKQTLATPPPPQVYPVGQAPQVNVPPQPSPTDPQYWPPPEGVQVPLVQLVGGGVPRAPAAPPPPQVWPVGQVVPQSSDWPQPSPITP